jgi:hypothetical protein
MAVFRMAGGLGAELAELLDVFHRHVLVTGEEQQRIKEHGTVAGRQHETVAVRPERVLRIEFQKAGKEDGRDIGSAHRQAGMAGIGLLYSIHGKESDRVRHPVMFVERGHG